MTPRVSVVVAARSGPAALDRLLAALEGDFGSGATELVVAAEPGVAVPTRPSVVAVPCPSGSALSALRAAGLLAARGEVIAMTRDVCVPETGWLARLEAALRREAVAAAGGIVALPEGASWADRVSHRLEYAGFRPGAKGGAVASLAATNVAYARDRLFRHRALFETDYREDALHAALAASGERLLLVPDARVRLESPGSLGVHAAQRFHAGRIHAARRRVRGGRAAGIRHALVAPALPALLVLRLFRRLAAEGESLTGAALHAVETVPLVLAGAAGELAGALTGPGDSERRLA